MATARRVRGRWHWLLTLITWILAFGLTGVLIAVLAGTTVRVYRSISGPSAAPTIRKDVDCSPSSAVPCTEREARLALQAKVDSGTVPVHPTVQENINRIDDYSSRIIEANDVKVKAEAEKDKAKWEQERYRELQRELQARRSAPAPASRGAVNCDSSPWARATCDKLMR
jgi:hypothetical protein